MYTMSMNINTFVAQIKAFQDIDESIVSTLYTLSIKSLAIVMILAVLTTIALYPVLHISIVFWLIFLTLVVSYRLYTIYQFEKYPKKLTIDRWYKQFVLLAMLTALIFSSLGFIFIHHLDYYYQLFILSIILGLSSGSAFALSSDIRISLTYMGILIVPLIVTLITLESLPLHGILATALSIYFVAQIIIIYNMYIQKKKIDHLESDYLLFNSLFKNAPLGIFTYNQDLEVIDCNQQLSDLFHHDIQTVIGLNLHDLPDNRPLQTFHNSLTQGNQTYKGPYTSLKGDEFWIEAKAFPFTNKINKMLGGVGVIENKTKEHNALEKLEHMVEHDSLTGLLNRRGFSNYIENLVNSETHQQYYSLLFYLDLNQFKAINDSLGHGVGDKVLLSVSKRLITVLDDACMVSRLGGDEFIIMIPHIAKDKSAAMEVAQQCSMEIQNAFLAPFIIQEMHLHIQASIGIVLIKPGESNTEEILRYADLTMYQAKTANGHISYYDSSLDKKQKDLFMLQHNLVYATKNNQFKLFFQPIVKMKDESLHAAELLIRWEHPTRGMLSPEEFIPLAIKGGLLSKITWWLVDNVCQQIVQWKNDGQWKLEYISININPQQLIENHFATEFFKKLKFYGIQTSEVMLEITERSLIDNFANTQGVINDLKSHGIKCAIDDFGIGYSSLSYLKKLSFHTLKIDRTFVKDIGQSPKELVLINTILELGRQFGYNIVIEGIENDQQKQALLELDQELSYQGYFYSKPIKADEFTKKFLT